jgi:probable F420-dependent oxidoreductase
VQFTVQYPIAQANHDPGFRDSDVLTRFATAAEEAGFSAIAFTEHPAPSEKWMRAGGHDSLDPFAALGFCAAVTHRLKLMTYLLVLPYRNPLLAAKGAATVDVLSGGRLVLGVGSGYLRSEFAALGVEFAERGELFDEAVEAMRGIWTTEDFTFSGKHFTAPGQTASPRPVQHPGPPLWIGGNSRVARARAARYGDGWTPLLNNEAAANTTRTALIDSPAQLAAAVRELRNMTADAGRDPGDVTVQVESAADHVLLTGDPLERHVERLHEIAEAGADWSVVRVPAGHVGAALDGLARYGAEVITALGDT